MGIGDDILGFFQGKYNNEINAALTPKCETTNQGARMDDIRDEIVKINDATKDILAKARDEIANYYKNLPLFDLVTANNTLEATYDKLIKDNDKLQGINDTTEQNYIKEQKQLGADIVVLQSDIISRNTILKGHSNDIDNIEKYEILPKISQIKKQYLDINNIENDNDKAAIRSNNLKTDIQRASFSIAYLEYLVIDAYKQLYRSIYYENVSVGDGIKQRFDNHTNQFSINNYQNQRIQFYKNINTFLFYLYYVMIIALVIVVLKFNSTSILIKLTFFRVFAIILILYPLFIIRLQNFVFKFVTLLLSKL